MLPSREFRSLGIGRRCCSFRNAEAGSASTAARAGDGHKSPHNTGAGGHRGLQRKPEFGISLPGDPQRRQSKQAEENPAYQSSVHSVILAPSTVYRKRPVI